MSRDASKSQRVRLGLIGAGGFGSYTTELLDRQPEIDLVGVADTDRDKAERLGSERGVPSWSDHRALLDECNCDAVAVVTPHSSHRDIVVDAAAAGRHIFCEKTMAITVADCHDMLEAADAHGVKLMVGHKRRFRPAAVAIRQALASDGLGRPLAVNVRGYFVATSPDSGASGNYAAGCCIGPGFTTSTRCAIYLARLTRSMRFSVPSCDQRSRTRRTPSQWP